MTMSVEAVEAAALQLPPAARAHLAKRLIESLDDDADEDLGEVERAWEDEIIRRLAEYDAGDVQAVPASEVFAELRRRRA
jgi:putative addiction module component (TIGR02574 family)